jgi:hypothetical protein
MSDRAPATTTDDAAAILSVLAPGLRRIDDDIELMSVSLLELDPEVDAFPESAFGALDAALAHVRALRRALTSPRLVRLHHPARTHAVAGLAATAEGLERMRALWVSYGATGSGRTNPRSEALAAAALTRGRSELHQADVLLDCPLGCPDPPVREKLPAFGSQP